LTNTLAKCLLVFARCSHSVHSVLAAFGVKGSFADTYLGLPTY
jgi:hypothetical protein